MKRRLVAIFAMLAMTLTFAPAVSAQTQGNCPIGDTTKVLMYENINGDHSDGDDALWLCGGTSNLAQPHTPPGSCHALNHWLDDWNDCLDHAVVYVPSGAIWCVYRNAGYSVLEGGVAGPASGFNYQWQVHDVVSSEGFFSGNSCPT